MSLNKIWFGIFDAFETISHRIIPPIHSPLFLPHFEMRYELLTPTLTFTLALELALTHMFCLVERCFCCLLSNGLLTKFWTHSKRKGAFEKKSDTHSSFIEAFVGASNRQRLHCDSLSEYIQCATAIQTRAIFALTQNLSERQACQITSQRSQGLRRFPPFA